MPKLRTPASEKPEVFGIIGSRRRDTEEDYRKTFAIFTVMFNVERGDRIVSGGCPQGGDRFAERIVEYYGLRERFTVHNPDLSMLNPNLPRHTAYVIIVYDRNQLIADDATILIAVTTPDRKGSAEDDIIHRFCKRLKKTQAELIALGRLILL